MKSIYSNRLWWRKAQCLLQVKQGVRAVQDQKIWTFDGLAGRVFKGKFGVRVAGCVSSLIGWWWDNGVVLRASCPQPEVTILLWARALVPLENFKDIFVCVSLEEEPGLILLLLYCCTAFPLFLHPLISQLVTVWIYPFGTQEKSRKLEAFNLQIRNGAFVLERAPRFQWLGKFELLFSC